MENHSPNRERIKPVRPSNSMDITPRIYEEPQLLSRDNNFRHNHRRALSWSEERRLESRSNGRRERESAQGGPPPAARRDGQPAPRERPCAAPGKPPPIHEYTVPPLPPELSRGTRDSVIATTTTTTSVATGKRPTDKTSRNTEFRSLAASPSLYRFARTLRPSLPLSLDTLSFSLSLARSLASHYSPSYPSHGWPRVRAYPGRGSRARAAQGSRTADDEVAGNGARRSRRTDVAEGRVAIAERRADRAREPTSPPADAENGVGTGTQQQQQQRVRTLARIAHSLALTFATPLRRGRGSTVPDAAERRCGAVGRNHAARGAPKRARFESPSEPPGKMIFSQGQIRS